MKKGIVNTPPNFVLILPDQWRGDCGGYLGHPVVETPFLDQLASEGTIFTNCYTACPTCIATRACLATGQSPSTCGRIGYKDGIPWRYEETLMKCLREGGYQTLCAGKTHFFPQRAHLGFEEMLIYYTHTPENEIRSDYHIWLEKASDGLVLNTANEISTNSWLAHPWVHPEFLHSNTWTVNAAIELLERRDPLRPFFLQVGFHRPHPPFDPPLHYYEMYNDKELPPVPVGEWVEESSAVIRKVDGKTGRLPDHILNRTRRAYYAQLTHIDYQIGRLLHWLREKRWLDQTFIIFLSDHGEMLGDHNMFSKIAPFEGSAKVPFIIKAPVNYHNQMGRKCDQPVTHMDVMPTLLEQSGIPIPRSVEGSSLLPLIRQEKIRWREFVHGEHAPGEGSKIGWQFVTDGREKYMWDTVTGKEWFFDLERDPKENSNLILDQGYQPRVEQWRNRLIEVLADRKHDGLSDGIHLVPGRALPPVRPELLEKRLDPDGHTRPSF
jgi:arylsulfatase